MMRDYNSFIDKYIRNRAAHKKYVSAFVAMSMLVSFAVSLLLTEPAVSQTYDTSSLSITTPSYRSEQGTPKGTQVNNLNGGVASKDGLAPGSLTDVTLLIGQGRNWAENCETPADVSREARKNFFLGIASDFSVFLENNFNPTAADAEGRVAVGGNVVFLTKNQPYDYQIGAGDYYSSVALKNTDNYEGATGFAHLILGTELKDAYICTANYNDEITGSTLIANNVKMIKNISTFGTRNFGKDFAYDNDDLYKRIAVPSSFDLSATLTNNEYGNYVNTHGGSDENKVYQYVEYQNNHQHEKNNGTKNIDEKAAFYQYSDSKPLINFTEEFAWLRSQSRKLSAVQATGTAVKRSDNKGIDFDGLGNTTNSGAKTVYFNVSKDVWNTGAGYIFTFDNIPEYIDENGNKQLANIIVNVEAEADNSTGIWGSVATYVNTIAIHNTGTGDDFEYNSQFNNSKKSEKILYNFYNAKNLVIKGNFNGTILAPNADVKSNYGCPGHLSGALIAKSFAGGLEFGYRPYRGASDIMTVQSGYVVPVDKISAIEGNPNLAGALLELTEGDNETYIDSWTSNDSTKYAFIPSEIDYTGATNYATGETVTKTYYIKEKRAPEGYIKTNDCYKIVVNEQVLVTKTESDLTVPTQVKTTFNIYKNDSADPETYYEITVDDFEAQYRTITINENGTERATFTINFTDNNGTKTVDSVLYNGSNIDINSINNNIYTDGNNSYYYDAKSLMIMPLPASNLTFTNKPGLNFKKVDNSKPNNPVSGATIKMYKQEGESFTEVSNSIWNWSGTNFTIDIENLPAGTYKFSETTPPKGYEKAADIYLKVDVDNNDKKTLSTSSSNGDWTRLEPAETGVYTIEMIDVKAPGAKITLEKYDDNFNEKLSGSIFSLYPYIDGAESNEAIATGLEVGKDGLDLYDALKVVSGKDDYVQNGYLKPGQYYLKETTAPKGYECPTEKFAFTVEDDFPNYTVKNGIIKKIRFESNNLENVNGNAWRLTANVDAVSKIEIVFADPSSSGNYEFWETGGGKFDGRTASITDGKIVLDFDTPINFTKVKVQASSDTTRSNISDIYLYSGSEVGAAVSTATYPSETVQDISFQHDSDLIAGSKTVPEITIYYADFSNKTFNNVGFRDQYSNTYVVNIDPKEFKNIIGIKIKKPDFVNDSTGVTIRKDNEHNSSFSNWWDKFNTNADEKWFGIDSEPQAPLTIKVVNDNTIQIPNKPLGGTVGVSVEKMWDDDNNKFSSRPENISVCLKRSYVHEDSTIVQYYSGDTSFVDTKPEYSPITLNISNEWKWEKNGFERYVPDTETEWQYSFEEVTVDGYDREYKYIGSNCTITNTLTKNHSVQFVKQWDKKVDESVALPTNITVKLQWKKENDPEWQDWGDPVTVTADNEWKYTFEPLYGGVQYQVVETDVPPGWTAAPNPADVDENGTATITNTYVGGSITVQKEWSGIDTDKVDVDSVYVALYQSNTSPEALNSQSQNKPKFNPSVNPTSFKLNQQVKYYASAPVTMDWSGKQFGTAYALPSEVDGQKISRIDIYTNANLGHGRIGFNNYAVSVNYNNENKESGKTFVSVNINNIISNGVTIDRYWDGGNVFTSVSQLVFHFDDEEAEDHPTSSEQGSNYTIIPNPAFNDPNWFTVPPNMTKIEVDFKNIGRKDTDYLQVGMLVNDYNHNIHYDFTENADYTWVVQRSDLEGTGVSSIERILLQDWHVICQIAEIRIYTSSSSTESIATIGAYDSNDNKGQEIDFKNEIPENMNLTFNFNCNDKGKTFGDGCIQFTNIDIGNKKYSIQYIVDSETSKLNLKSTNVNIYEVEVDNKWNWKEINPTGEELTALVNSLAQAIMNKKFDKAYYQTWSGQDNEEKKDIQLASITIIPDTPTEIHPVEAKIPNGATRVQIIELKKSEGWTATVTGLDMNAYYYIVEVNSNGEPITELRSENDIIYRPTAYVNGKKVGDTLTVRNTYVGKDENAPLRLPATGGTGTKRYYLIGMMFIAFGFVYGVFFLRRRKRHNMS